MSALNIVLLGRMASAGSTLLKGLLKVENKIVVLKEPESIQDNIHVFDTADVIVGGPITAEIAGRISRLKLFYVFRGGIDGLGIEHLHRDVLIANTYHHETGIAEFVIMAMLMLPRQVFLHDQRLRKGKWKGSVRWGESPQQETMMGKTALIVGPGHIGREVAVRARAFGMRLVGVSRTPDRSVPYIDRIAGYSAWREELSQADYVVSSVRLAPNTEGLFGPEEFAMMKETSYFINVSRGTVVQEKALYEALRDRKITGAAIDVWYNYPETPEETCYPSRFPFHELTNILMSPHRSSWTKQMLEARVRDVAENIERLTSGRPLINPVQR